MATTLHSLFTNPYVIRLLQQRGINTPEELNIFDPLEETSPKNIAHIPKAATIIKKFATANKRITIFGDYDADGVLSTFILHDIITRHLGANNVNIILPRREDGYGLTQPNIDRINASKPDLLILIDNGIAYAQIVDQLADRFNIVIVDHHTYTILPKKAGAIVHPFLKRLPTLQETCSTMLAYKIARYLLKDTADKYLELAALGIITDVMPLVGENRLIVKRGIHQIRTHIKSIIARLRHHSAYKYVDTFLLGNIIGPQFNAPGRLGDPMPAFNQLTRMVKDSNYQDNLLLRFNKKRKIITEDSLKQLESLMLTVAGINFVIADDIPKGVVGLIAGRLTDKTGAPTLVLTRHKDTYHGSGRAPDNFDLIGFLRYYEDLFIRLGGHKQAAGFEISKNNLDTLLSDIKSSPDIPLKYTDETTPSVPIPITLEDLNHNLLQALEFLEPYGAGNPPPVFELLLKDTPKQVRRDSTGKHIFISPENTKGSPPIRIVWWNAPHDAETKLTQKHRLLGGIDLDLFRGTFTITFKIKEVVF